MLDVGETETIALALETTDSLSLIDEKAGLEIARRLQLKTVGTIGILMLAKEHQLVPALAPLLRRLTEELNFFLSDDLIKQILKHVSSRHSPSDVLRFKDDLQFTIASDRFNPRPACGANAVGCLTFAFGYGYRN